MSNGKHLKKGSAKPVLPDDNVPRLYSMRFCPYSQRVHLVLIAKKIPYHSIFINLTEKPEWFPEVSPLTKSPALELVSEPGKPSLIESLVIAEYLDDKYEQNPLLPKDPLKKAQDKILIERFNAVTGAFTKTLYQKNPAEDIWNALEIFEQELSKRGTPYFAGDKIGFVDYMLWPWVERFEAIKYYHGDDYAYDVKRFNNLAKWTEQLKNDEAVKSYYVDPVTHAKFWQIRQTDQAAYDILADA